MHTCLTGTHTPFVQERAAVTHHERVSSRYFLLRLRCAAVAERAKPGQFVMLACTPDETSNGPLLPRPLAILDARGGEIELLYFVGGQGTQMLRAFAEAAARGEHRDARLRIIGPLGRGFTPVPGADAHLLLGGGSGMAPLIFFCRRQANAANATAWRLILGARTAADLPDEDTTAAPGRVLRATDDGTTGFRGTVVDAAEELLNGELKRAKAAVYAAGPEPMMRAAAQLARRRGLPARVSLEQRMACGVGVCRACVVDGATPHAKTGLQRRTVCQDGPVFDIDELAGW